jgi:phosphoenolpyruvate carboxykinase (GTP)
MGVPPPKEGINWKGEKWTPESGEKGAHPNSRFTAPAGQCPSIAPNWEDPKGVPISAMIFGGRRSNVVPLVFESLSWQHGTYVGATMTSETTAAAVGAVGNLRRDPMAMIPFCGYHMGDYWGHWLNVGKRLKQAPKIFHVNWFRKNKEGKFLWPGFGDNLRVIQWILERCRGEGKAEKTPIGYVPAEGAIHTEGLNMAPESMKELCGVDSREWVAELEGQEEFLKKFGNRLPEGIRAEKEALSKRLQES